MHRSNNIHGNTAHACLYTYYAVDIFSIQFLLYGVCFLAELLNAVAYV